MPILANLFYGLFTGLAGYIAKYFSKKTALWVTVASGLAIVFGILTVAVGAAIAGLTAAIPEAAATGLSWLIPPQLPAIIAARFTVEAALAAYRYQLNLQLTIAASA